MKSYAEGQFNIANLELLGKVEKIVAAMPSRTPDGELIRCHEVAAIVGELFGLGVQEGKYGAVDHSWLWLTTGQILDPYVPGHLPQVQIIDNAASLPYVYHSHCEGSIVKDLNRDFVKAQVCKLREVRNQL